MRRRPADAPALTRMCAPHVIPMCVSGARGDMAPSPRWRRIELRARSLPRGPPEGLVGGHARKLAQGGGDNHLSAGPQNPRLQPTRRGPQQRLVSPSRRAAEAPVVLSQRAAWLRAEMIE